MTSTPQDPVRVVPPPSGARLDRPVLVAASDLSAHANVSDGNGDSENTPAPAKEDPTDGAGSDPTLACIELVCELMGQPVAQGALGEGFARRADGRLDPAQWVEAVQAHGMAARWGERELSRVPAYALPLVLVMRDGSACVLVALPPNGDGGMATVLLPESGQAAHRVAWADLQARYSGTLLFVKPRATLDQRGDHVEVASPTRWFWDILLRYRSYYVHAGVATVVVNVLTVVGSLFAMMVYDRVVPNQAYQTLWVLAVGVTLAALFEFAARMLRAWLTDMAGKKADIVMSSVLFRRVLGLRVDQRPESAGSFANTLRDFESVRDFATSATLLAVADMPFVLLFVALMSVVAGPLAWIPLGAMVLILAATWIAQWPISGLMTRYMQGMSRKQSVAVEAVEGLEAIKANRAESLMQARWDDTNAQTAEFSARSRMINAWVMGFVTVVQQLTAVLVIVWGVYRIQDNLLTMGGLIAASMLAARAIAPVSQFAGLGLRWQQARTALRGLNALMARPQARDASRAYVHVPRLSGALRCQHVTHRYGDKPDQPNAQQPNARASVDRVNLDVRRGERVAVLGKVGSGKSTLLRLVAGLLPVSEGSVMLDGLELQQIEPGDVRASVAYLGQDPALFHGTLKENILFGLTDVPAARLSLALQMTGLDRVVAAHPRGLDLPIGEHGVGLSGGQRQLVALARLFVRNPSIVLLDEPTSAMDHATELQIMRAMGTWLQGRTLLLVTHRMPWVSLAERVVVLDEGRVLTDGPRDAVMQRLSSGGVPLAARRAGT